MNIKKLIDEIKKIYNIVNSYFNGYSLDNSDTNPIVITGSAAILYYLVVLGYDDLIKEMVQPSDLDLLFIYNSRVNKMKPTIRAPYIGDFKRISDISSSVTFKDEWSDLTIRSFDLTSIPSSGLRYNSINGIKIIRLNELLNFYEADKELETRKNDLTKICLINKMIARLEQNPRPDIIKQEENPFGSSRYKVEYESKPKKLTFDLFDDSDEDTDTSKKLNFDLEIMPKPKMELEFGKPIDFPENTKQIKRKLFD